MATTPALNITHLEANQSSPEITENESKDILSTTIADYIAINFAADADYTFTTGSGVQEWHHAQIRFTDTGPVLTAARNVIVPDEPKKYVFWNSTAQDLTFKTSAGSLTVIVLAGDSTFFRCDGSEVYLIASGAGGTALTTPGAQAMDPATLTDADITLSNNDLTVTHAASAAQDGVLALRPLGATKLYYEVLIDDITGGANSIEVLLAPNTVDLQASIGAVGFSGLVVGDNESTYQPADGSSIFLDNEGRTLLSSVVATDRINIAVDPTYGHLWVGKNGTYLDSGNPATGANPYLTIPELREGLWYPGVQLRNAVAVTFAFDSAAWTDTAPSGFNEIPDQYVHRTAAGAEEDVHPQYVNEARGDIRYFANQAPPRLEDDATHGSNVTVYEPEGRVAVHSSLGVTGTAGCIHPIGPGKVYMEAKVLLKTTDWLAFGVMPAGASRGNFVGEFAGDGVGYRVNGRTMNEGTTTTGLTVAAVNDIVSIAVDVSTGEFWFAINGVWESGDPALGTSPSETQALIDEDWDFVSSHFGINEAEVYFLEEDFTYAIPAGFTTVPNTPLHSSLTGLDANDHPQYMLVSDTIGALVWDDVRTALTAAQGGGLNDPNWVQVVDNGSGSTGVFAYAFDDNSEEELFFEVQLPHGYSAGTDIKPHVHWAPSTTGTGNVVWGLEYTVANVGAVIGNTTLLSVTDAASGTALQQEVAGFGTISGTGLQESTILLFRIYRDAGNAADTYAADAFGLSVDIHIQLEKRGSLTEFP